MSLFESRAEMKFIKGGIAQLVEQTAHIRWVIGPSPIAAKFSTYPVYSGGVFFSTDSTLTLRLSKNHFTDIV